MPSIPSVPLISARPSLARSTSGARPASASAVAPSTSEPSGRRASPSPSSTRAADASGARSPLAPSEPCSRTSGVIPALSRASIVSTTSARAPEKPIARLRARSSTIARTTSRSTSGPIPAACERTSAVCSSAERSAGITVLASAPNPVDTPYTGSTWWTSRSTTAAPRVDGGAGVRAELDTAPVPGDGDDVAGRHPAGTEHEGPSSTART